MTEEEWFACTDPKMLRKASRAIATDRKDRLFLALYWCWHGDRLGAEQLLGNAAIAAAWAERGRYPTPLFVEGISNMEDGEPVHEQVDFVTGRPDSGVDDAESLAFYAIWIREIFGNPFRPVSVDPSWVAWNDGTVVKLAQAIYDDRTFDHLPILADALEEAGCDNADILNHCRKPGVHVRGCWVVDLILGKK
jgi:hypothetical protein